ncbi:MAG: DUF5666 domain-containing protein, partial [Methanothrix sp.]|nr:DUF5666 domain-containing protein [Methanothrix sp.]
MTVGDASPIGLIAIDCARVNSAGKFSRNPASGKEQHMKSFTSYLGFLNPRTPRGLAVLAASALLALLASCGGDNATPAPPATGTVVQVNMGDAPADWMLSFTMNLSSMSLTSADGNNVSVTPTSTAVEMIHRLGTVEPISVVSVAKGTYSGASLTIASCDLTYIDPTTNQQVQTKINGPFNVSVPFSPNATVGDTPLAFNFDLDLEHSLTTDGSGAFQFTPVFHMALGSQSSSGGGSGSGNGSGNGASVNARHGGMYQMMGIVNAVSADSFSIAPHQASNTFTFQISSETRFQGRISQMAQLGTGMGVMVTATLQQDGTLLATSVRATMSASGAMGGGIVTSVTPPTGQPATAFTFVMQNGAGASVNTDYLSKTLTVNVTDGTTFEIDTDRVSLEGLPFTPVFDRSNINAGQSVLPFSESEIVAGTTPCDTGDTSCGTLTASTVRLREQGFRGTTDVAINPGTASTFTLTLMPDCAFTALTG